MGQIALEGMDFFAYHGFTDEEQQTGNKYSVDVFIETDLLKSSLSDNLNDTIDYSVIYTIVKAEMQIKSRLLEHIGYRIIEQIKTRFKNAEKVKVQVSKFNPPVGGIVFRSKITVEDK